VRDEIETFRTSNVQPLGVNPASATNHASYARKLGLPFPLLSDPDREVAAAYRALKPDGHGIQRTVYAIRSDGTVAFAARGAPLSNDIVAPFRP
jgi:thioredoxin-dependent peroxiredoxin